MQEPLEPSVTPSGLFTTRRRLLLGCLLVAALSFLGLSWQQSAAAGVTLQDRLEATWQRALHAFRGPTRVGIQIGHLNAAEHPEELASLRYNTGGHWGGVDEVTLNLAVAEHLKAGLEQRGIRVDLLPATVPPSYQADLVLSLHADASPDPARRGYKSAHFTDARYREGRNRLESVLKQFIDQAYFYYSGLPDDDSNVSGAMLQYYAFNHRRFKHSVASSTPAVIVEMGYLSNAEDMRFLNEPVNPAYALRQGILAYLSAQGRLPDVRAER